MPAPVSPQDFSEIRWRGHWIWVPEEPIVPGSFLPTGERPAGKESHGLFRKTVHLDRVPDRAPARITADSRYALFVNGQEVFRGPIRSQPHRLQYDLCDLTPYLSPGRNILAVYVKYYGTPTSYWMPAVPNVMLGKNGILVFEADLGDAGWLASDATWKARRVDAWSDEWRASLVSAVGGGVPIEVFDAGRFPHAWREADFDDSAWGTAQVVPAVHIGGFARTQPPTDPYGPLHPRPIARLGGGVRTPTGINVEILEGVVDAAIGSPVKRVEAALTLPVARAARAGTLPLAMEVPAGGTVRVTLDMGRIVSGLVQFALDAPAGTVLDLSYVEEPVKGPAGMIGTHAGTRYIARGADDQFQVFDSNGLRYAHMLVHQAQGPVTLRSFSVREQL
ncbi:MAG TPA: alpha-L-rhamnosidase N-terminal domain-containing protein, partial [Chloroflexota bacterium]|nr:alpha-L-rhamnosidase N-terminal domain-containing protein [Chloroflexota bacterium]